MQKKIGFLAGLPRTGSTLFSCILAQNNNVHVSGGSPLARLMFGTYDVCHGYAKEGLIRTRRTDFTNELLFEIPRLFYKNVEKPYILEKDRAWAYDPLNFMNYITESPKIVVLLRSIPEIIESFIYIKIKNKDVLPERDLLVAGVDPLMDALRNTLKCLKSEDSRYIFGTYDQLLHNPSYFIAKAYEHYEWKPFFHNFDNIEDLHLEDDAAFHTQGLHDVRPKLERRKISVKVSAGLMKQAHELDDILWAHVENSIKNTPHRHI
jgi:sulfotransferase